MRRLRSLIYLGLATVVILAAYLAIERRYLTPETPVPPAPTERQTLPRTGEVAVTPNRLTIATIGVNVPIVWDADPSTLDALEGGVAHYRGTASPNVKDGNVFIYGHSSGYPWDKNPYTTVFTKLPKVKIGDDIAVTTDSATYTYRVFDTLVVRPDDLYVLGYTPTPILSLMTCVPIGTYKDRLVVQAALTNVSQNPLPVEREAEAVTGVME